LLTFDTAARGTRHAALAAAASVFVPIALVAWVSWQVIEGDDDTLVRSQFQHWATVSFCAAALVLASAGAFWRSRNVLVGVASGVVVAGLAVAGGLMVDIVTSGGLA
jgi:hypothetical protein